MALRKESWLELAQRLQPGQRKYVDHVDCGAGRTLVISYGEHGLTAHCFRCTDDGFHAHGERNLAELLNVNFGLMKQEQEFEQGRCVLPQDFTLEIPERAALWLYKAGVFKSTAAKQGFGWSGTLGRVILPVYQDSKLVYMQARSVDGRKPKYLNNSALQKGSVLYRARGCGAQAASRVCAITEDILSALRVSVSVPAASTLGTNLSAEQAYVLSQDYDEFLLWYDGDSAGVKGAVAAIKTLRLLGCNVRRVVTTKDPKRYSNREILEILTTGEALVT